MWDKCEQELETTKLWNLPKLHIFQTCCILQVVHICSFYPNFKLYTIFKHISSEDPNFWDICLFCCILSHPLVLCVLHPVASKEDCRDAWPVVVNSMAVKSWPSITWQEWHGAKYKNKQRTLGFTFLDVCFCCASICFLHIVEEVVHSVAFVGRSSWVVIVWPT